MKLSPLTHPAFIFPGLHHGFFTREGGVSQGVYASLNTGLGSGDNRAHVLENRTRIAGWYGVGDENLVTCYQTHSAIVHHVTQPWAGDRPEGDALVTTTPNLVLGIGTADCGPVLFHDPVHQVIGAAHAGWKGAVGGVLEATIAAMEKLGSTRATIHAVLGPCIHAQSYEVSDSFPEPFLMQDIGNGRFFMPAERPDHFMFDLPGYIQHRLKIAGLGAVHSLWRDTYSDETLFFSYRRATHRGEANGTLLSTIMLSAA